jgi:predicted RNA binding protein YcfA (HicA-like mRNA interferase family)
MRNIGCFPAMGSRVVLAALKADGWQVVGRKGSDVQLTHPPKLGASLSRT